MAKQAKKPQDTAADAPVKRFKVGRGSTRRITNALTTFDKAIAAFIKEMDLQFFVADKDGKRATSWDFVSKLQDMRKEITETVNDQLYPVTPDETDGE